MKISGTKRPRLQPLPAEFSPLCSPVSTPEQRNAYLRTMGIGRMREVILRSTHIVGDCRPYLRADKDRLDVVMLAIFRCVQNHE